MYLSTKALKDKIRCCRSIEENCREPICKGCFSQHRPGNASGMPSNHGPWSSRYFTSIFNASFISKYSQCNWTSEGGCPKERPFTAVWRQPNDLIYLTQVSWNRTRAPSEEEDESRVPETWGGRSVRKGNDQMVLMVRERGRKWMAYKCQVVARGGPQRLVRAVGTA